VSVHPVRISLGTGRKSSPARPVLVGPVGPEIGRFATVEAPAFLTGDDVPDYLKGVEIVTAGMNWPASTGSVTVTMEHIADAVRAANDDPHIQVPRLKLGHTSALNGGHPDHDPFAELGDAVPAFGRFVNLRTENDGAVLVGDVTDIPAWLAESAPSAFPNRSMECVWNVTTEADRSYSMVITAVSFLGAYLPACKDLEDLVRFVNHGPDAFPTNAGRKETPMPHLSVSTDRVRRAFNFEWATDPENGVEQDTYWWWARDVRVDPAEVIADDDEGGLWLVPFSTDGEDTVTFGEPQAVRQTYTPVAASAGFARPTKGPRSTAATGRPEQEDSTMDDNVREFLVAQGIDPDTATEDQINAASVFSAPGIQPTAPEAQGDEPEVEVDDVEPAREQDPIAAAQAQAFETLSEEVRELRAREEQRATAASVARRDETIRAALTAGRISPAERQHYRDLLDVDEERAGALLTALPEGRIPMGSRSESPDPSEASEAVSLADSPILTPNERARLRARQEA
jgi:hypothetical protein